MVGHTMTLKGKCALITGSVQGLGLAAAHRFADAGCDIVLNGFAEPELIVKIRTDIESRCGVRTLYCGADLRRPPDIGEMVAAAVETFGGVDILVNNAVFRHSAPIEEFPVDKWDETLAVNLSAAFHTIRLALPGMRRRNWGRIVNVSSIYGLQGTTNRVGYVTSKTALLGMTRAVALETLRDNITCNAICPGTTDTPVHDATIREMMAAGGLSRAEAEQRFFLGKQPSGRFVGADTVAALMLFLCGPDSRDITGAAMPIDGGWSAS
jgi:3-hydroxybutyrate dehydrogenase